jgi:hypothetical protein
MSVVEVLFNLLNLSTSLVPKRHLYSILKSAFRLQGLSFLVVASFLFYVLRGDSDAYPKKGTARPKKGTTRSKKEQQ